MIRSHIIRPACVGLLFGMAVGAGGAGPARAETVPPHVPGRILVQFKPTATAEQVRNLIAAANARVSGEIPHTGVKVLQIPANANEVAIQRAFAQRPEVRFAEFDELRKVSGSVTPNDYYYLKQWHLPKISAPTAWSTTTGSGSVVIAICDTGCEATHPDLSPKYVPGWNFYDNNSNTADVFGHGTAVAGVAAAASDNTTGVASVAWGCLIMPLRISATDGTATFSAAASAITWAADRGARVANISYQMSDSSAVASAASYMQGKGGVVTVAAGNNGVIDSAADNPYVLTVSATDNNDTICSWSNTGNNIDVAAPGSGVYTTATGGGYSSGIGTSFSAPIVAGVAALVISANPALTGSQVRSILEQSADDLGTAGWDAKYGWGRINAAKAVAMAGGGPVGDTTPPTIAISGPTAGAAVSGTATIQVSASDNIGVASVSVYVDSILVGSSGSAPFGFAWNSSSVSNGTHVIQAVAADAANNQATSSVSVAVSNNSDTSPPVVAILNPASNTKVGSPLTVAVSATDNVGVMKVELWIDGKLVATDALSPWSFSVNTKTWKSGSKHTLVAKGYDAAGNAGASSSITVTK